MSKDKSHIPYWLVLTHDIDVMSLKELPITGRTFWGFTYRCLVGNFFRFVKKKISLLQYLDSLKTFLFIPAIKLGLAKDPLKGSIQVMLDIERKYGVRSTLYFVPYAKRAGHKPDGKLAPSNRCVYYELADYKDLLVKLEEDGWEVGVHGIDAYHTLKDAQTEIQVIKDMLPEKKKIGIRIHWLYHKGQESWQILDSAGYYYDATLGWNDRIGYPEGIYRPFKPKNVSNLTVLPLNIQDGALLIYQKLSFDEAWIQIKDILEKASQKQAVVTVLWHNNSYVVYRYWTDLYKKIIEQAISDGAEIIRAVDAVDNLTILLNNHEL